MTPTVAVVPVLFDEDAIAYDLAHLTAPAAHALDQLRRELDRDGGLTATRLRRCQADARDATNLAGCIKTYVPWPTGAWGLVTVPVSHPQRAFALRVFAYGVRHPEGRRPSVYQIAHQRLHA